MILMLVIVAIMIAAFVFWVLMLIDCVKRDFKGDNDKVVWILVLVFVGFIGALIYYFVIRRPAKKHR
ncbi:PLDc N-terminal domain-containing protein [Candidatus Woesearchaeota archaeon]|nr:PLDc N-terminal domain-containing protein [Candidatus Woesearchaeota archaeon]MBW3014186.1 PLDc N-terminal domain-containing protein [Candidatus Woesearchaeota archaeon]